MSKALRLALLVALLLFLVFADTPEPTLFWEALFDFGHAPLSGVVALLMRDLIVAGGRPESTSRRRASLLALGLTVALGGVVEAVQSLQPNRSASWEDLARDAAGALSFLLLRHALAAAASARGSAARLRAPVPATAAALALLAASAVELGRTAALYAERDAALPTLFALDGSRWESELIEPRDSRLVARATGLARLDLAPARYPGLAFNEPYPDWTGYRQLVFTIVSDLEAPLPMAIRIHDAAHDGRFEDRFNRRLLVEPGRNQFAIDLDEVRLAPRGRQLDLRRIRGIMIFASRLDHPVHVYVGPLGLE